MNERRKPPKAYSYVRMSTDMQIKGDSLRRQTASSQLYAAEQGLELAPPIEDIGISGYRGSNREFGNLARFLDQIDRGLIERGSYLIVESLDRLSRQNVFQAFTLLGEIIQSGVKVVTLMDGQTYDEKSLSENQGQIFLALGSMLRAHEESRVKSKRIAAVWVQKRSEAQTKKLTAVVPAWLQLSADRARIEIQDKRAPIVVEIFELARDGYGAYSIARKFNRRNEPTWSARATLWHESYIKKILENRAVLGEYQPGVVSYAIDNKRRRVPAGDPVAGYFPAVVESDLFLAAHAAINTRKTSGRGRKGPKFSNLFTGLARCGHCGFPMRFGQKSSPQTREAQYLRCSSSRSEAGCVSPAWRYVHFEQSFLQFLRKVDLRFVLGGQKQDELGAQLERRRLTIDAEIAGFNQSIDNLVEAIAESPGTALSKKVTELESKVAGLEAERTQTVAALNEIDQSRTVMSKEEIAGLLDRITSPEGTDLEENPRRLLASEINRVIRRIDVFSNGPIQPWEVDDSDLARRIEGMTLHERKMLNSHYIIHYRTGESEYVQTEERASVIFPTNTRERLESNRTRPG